MDLFDLGEALAPQPAPEPPLRRTHAVFYAAKPLLPRRVQLALRRAYAPLQARSYPDWPIAPDIARRRDAVLASEMARRGMDTLPLLAPWPDGKAFAYVLTHDVESAKGLARIEPLLALERRYGVHSAWFIVAEDYPVAATVLARLRGAGCEVGVHGIHHDGEMYRDRATFLATVPRVQKVLDAWGAVGFRSPATRRNAEWMPDLGCLYDTSYPDADPFEPQPGGGGSVLPYFLGDVVELPITMPQDHTLVDVLRRDAGAVWRRKADWVASLGGLVNVIVHPDYTCTPERLGQYEVLLRHLTARKDAWHALPRDVAAWWRARAAFLQGRPASDPAEAGWRARIRTAHARKDTDEIVIDL